MILSLIHRQILRLALSLALSTIRLMYRTTGPTLADLCSSSESDDEYNLRTKIDVTVAMTGNLD